MYIQKILIILFFISYTLIIKAQTSDFELIETVKSDTSTRIVYLTAVWCKPCMEKLDTLIEVFGKTQDPSLIILFDRYGYQKTYGKLKTLYDTSLFRMIPERYYNDKSKAIISFQVNPAKKMMKRFVPEIGNYLSKTLTLDDLWFGQAIFMQNGKLIILQEMDRSRMIQELRDLVSR